MKINEIFYSIEGEGKRVGQPAIFIRRSGCNLHCRYDGQDCDTPYRNEGTEMTVKEIMKKISEYPCKNVTLTGGEPLIPCDELDSLRWSLNSEGYKVNIETNGSIPIPLKYPNEFFTVDYKCGCSGMTYKMRSGAFRTLGSKDVIKFVVSESDFAQVEAQIKSFKKSGVLKSSGPFVYISPCYGRCDLQKLVDFVKSLYGIYRKVGLSLQIHKIIWSPEQRGV